MQRSQRSLFPKLPADEKPSKFISDVNISAILHTVVDELCISNFQPNKEFVNMMVRIMKRISRKYNTDDVEKLNKYTINELIEIMKPQYKVERVVQDTFLPLKPAPKILRSRQTGTGLNKRTKIPGTAIVHPTTTTTTFEPKKNAIKEKKITKDMFYAEGNTIFRPEFSVWENTDKKLFYNQDINVIYDPKGKKFYDANSGVMLDPGSKYTDVKVFFGLKKPTVIDKIQTGSKLGFYDASSGNIVSGGVSREVGTVSDQGQIKEFTISVDSRHRDLRVFPSASRYTIGFQNRSGSQFGFINNLADQIKGIVRIELIHGIVPNILKADTSSVPNTYFLLIIEEINGRYSFSSPSAKNIFGKLQFDLDLPINANYLDVDPVMCYREYHPEPRAIPLTAITISIVNFNGNQVDFGQDSFKLRYWEDDGAGKTTITTWLPHQLTTGDLIYFRFTDNPLLDNTLDGIVVLVISPTLFEVSIDSSTVAAGIAPNMGGPPVNLTDPANSAGQPFPTIPPNDPTNPTTSFGFILKPELQNAFTFKIITQEKNQTRVSSDQLIKGISGY